MGLAWIGLDNGLDVEKDTDMVTYTEFVWALSLFLHVVTLSTPWRWKHYPHFIDWEIEAKKGTSCFLE